MSDGDGVVSYRASSVSDSQLGDVVCDDDAFWGKTVLHDKLPHCGCGMPEAVTELVRGVLAAIADCWTVWRARPPGMPMDEECQEAARVRDLRLALLLGNAGAEEPLVHRGVHYFVLYALTDADLLEHGGEVGGSWLTDDGERLLAYLRGVDDLDEWEATVHLPASCPECGHDLTSDEHECECAWCQRNWRYGP